MLEDPPNPLCLSSRRRFVGWLLGGGGLVTAAACSQASPRRSRTASSAPTVIPALSNWAAGPTGFTLGESPKIVVAAGAVPLLSTSARLFAADVKALTGVTPTVTTGTPYDALTGDIYLALDHPELPKDAYWLNVRGALTISGSSDAGVFHGTRTVGQLLRQSTTIPGGRSTDAPAFPERSFMLDVARKYYSIGFLKSLVRELAWLKYNMLHLHLTDTQAFRLECDTHPAAVAVKHYTKAEMADLVSYAEARHITIVPEIDMPGHMNPMLGQYPDLALRRDNGYLSLDLSQMDAAYDLARSFISEYLDVFPGPRWSIGADEWLTSSELDSFPQLARAARSLHGPDATGWDLAYDFVNRLADYLRAHGRQPSMWNDQLVPGSVVRVGAGLTIEHWYGSSSPNAGDLHKQGYALLNSNSNLLYGDTDNDSYPDPEAIYDDFAVNRFALGKGSQAIPADSPHLRGAQMAIWSDSDNSYTEGHVASRIRDPLRSLAQITWGSPKSAADYGGFSGLINKVGSPPP
ncbi:glycoside hydrolase family 20 protein [Streptomyces sp. NPDC058045]|uniref:beta-N-acetylhexosaminidase n=1 Tax=Streptomyces sp. NPDC058045 TaxID=3346311 RepID=UPI0036E3462A